MLCSDCVDILYCNLSPEAAKILKTLTRRNEKLNQGEIIRLTGLSISITRDALNELKGSMLVRVETKGRGIYYSLSESVLQSMLYLGGGLSA